MRVGPEGDDHGACSPRFFLIVNRDMRECKPRMARVARNCRAAAEAFRAFSSGLVYSYSPIKACSCPDAPQVPGKRTLRARAVAQKAASFPFQSLSNGPEIFGNFTAIVKQLPLKFLKTRAPRSGNPIQ